MTPYTYLLDKIYKIVPSLNMQPDVTKATSNMKSHENPVEQPLVASPQKSLPYFNPVPNTGLAQLINHCSSIYPNQHSPFEFETGKCYVFQGGSNPLDLIRVYKNEGSPGEVPQHWHYIGFGLSDIHNFNITYQLDQGLREEYPKEFEYCPQLQDQVYPPQVDTDRMSGYGFELTFRLKCDNFEQPPLWPISIMQSLAKYAFQTMEIINEGDHCYWHKALVDESRINHFFFTLDAQLKRCELNSGSVKFIQLVGVDDEELMIARRWSASGLMKFMSEIIETGGCYLVTDINRDQSILKLWRKSGLESVIESKIESEGSDVIQICRRHEYSLVMPDCFNHSDPGNELIPNFDLLGTRSQSRNYLNKLSETDGSVERPSQIFLLIDLEIAKILTLILTNRLSKKKSFSINRPKGDLFTTFIPEGYEQDSLVNIESPLALSGPWLQIYVPEELRKTMSEELIRELEEPVILPKIFSWTKHRLHIIIIQTELLTLT